jgi:PPOX class probable F420-dependent enzyme
MLIGDKTDHLSGADTMNSACANISSAFTALRGQKYLNLETYRRSGEGVRTPVWFSTGPGATPARLYVYTTADSGKAKRIRRSDVVKIAACDMRGRVTGPWFDARAHIVTGAEHELGMKLLSKKYFPVKQILDLSVWLFPRHERVVLAITPS